MQNDIDFGIVLVRRTRSGVNCDTDESAKDQISHAGPCEIAFVTLGTLNVTVLLADHIDVLLGFF